MDIKSVLEEQVREMQNVQDKISCGNEFNNPNTKIAVAEEIRKLAETINNIG